jgi:NAD(P)-dependent dehydrogenase (short-subunit alcohol dehydrogenase family)
MEQCYFEIGERHVDSITSIKGMPVLSVYSASKAAIRPFAPTWSVDLKQRQIRVNAISPPTIPTPGYDQLGFSPAQMDAFSRLLSNSRSTRLSAWRTESRNVDVKTILMLDELECSMRTEGRDVAVWLTSVYIASENTDGGC